MSLILLVACLAEVLHRAKRHPADIRNLGFHVLAPASQIKRGIFGKVLHKESIFKKVSRRVAAYEGEKEWWFEKWFCPTWDKIDIQCLSWEEIILAIEECDTSAGASISLFYDYCLRFGH